MLGANLFMGAPPSYPSTSLSYNETKLLLYSFRKTIASEGKQTILQCLFKSIVNRISRCEALRHFKKPPNSEDFKNVIIIMVAYLHDRKLRFFE